MALYYPLTRELAVVGPYGRYHGLANTFAYTRQYLETHRFDDECACGEEPEFTEQFTAPMIQLQPRFFGVNPLGAAEWGRLRSNTLGAKESPD